MATSLANSVLIAILASGGAFLLFVFLRNKKELAAAVKPPELVRRMRRYGIDAGDVESADLGEEYICACRNCAACDRKVQCREWLALSPPSDISLFCGNEDFLNRVNRTKFATRRSQTNSSSI